MAYKFQLGNARINGDVILAGAAKVSGSLQSTQADDATAANIVAQIDDKEIPHTKVALEDGDFLIGDNSGTAQNRTLSGDVTCLANGTVTIANDAVTFAKMQHTTTNNRVLGASTAGEIGEVQVTNDMLAGSIANAKLANSAVTIGSSAVSLGGTAPSLQGIQGIQLDAGNNRIVEMAPTAHNVAGKDVEIRAGDTTAGTSDDVAGGDLVFQAGRGKGTGAGGSISFKVATAAGSSADTLNAANNALVIGQDKNAQFAGNLIVDGNLTVSGDVTTLDVANLLVEDYIIQVAKGAADDAASNNSGIQFGKSGTNGAGAQLVYKNNDGGERVLAALDGDGSGYLKFKATEFIGNLDGNASTATTLATARMIGGVNFNGSAAITPQNIDIADEENTNADRLIMFADGAGSQRPKNDGDLKYNPSTGRVTATQFAGDGSNLTGLPLSPPAVQNKNPNDTLQFGVNVLSSGGSDGVKVFRLPTNQANGDRLWIKAPSDAAGGRSMKITGSLAGPGLTIDGAASISLESADASVCLIYVGGNKWTVF